MMACNLYDNTILELLTECGADINLQNSKGGFVLMVACRNHYSNYNNKIIDLLINTKTNTDLQDYKCMTGRPVRRCINKISTNQSKYLLINI